MSTTSSTSDSLMAPPLKVVVKRGEPARHRDFWNDEPVWHDPEWLSEQADNWIDQAAVEDEIPECGHCGTVMQHENLGTGAWQMVCPNCGVAGPRAGNADRAASLAMRLFQTPR